MLPPRLKRETKPGMPKRIRCPAHLKWVREHACCVPRCNGAPSEAAHVRTGTDGGTGLKPSDSHVISLCQYHHAIQHRMGEGPFETKYFIDMKALAREFADKSPHRRKLR